MSDFIVPSTSLSKELTEEIKSIAVKAHETASAKTERLAKNIDDNGIVVSEIDYVDYLINQLI